MQTNNEKITKNTTFLKEAFKEYYFKQTKLIEVPVKIAEREFGYTRFSEHGMVRHLQFKSSGELVAMLMREVPSDVYCSNAYYSFPSYSIQEKRLLGADLIFDIDGKDLDLSCVPSHSYCLCSNCMRISKAEKSMLEFSCIFCNNKKFTQITTPCEKCIEGSKLQVQKLLKILTNELGIERRRIVVYFSGNNGFHIHIRDNEFVCLPQQARLRIVNYLVGNGFMVESVGVRKERTESNIRTSSFKISFPQDRIDFGWRARVLHKLGLDATTYNRIKNQIVNKGGYEEFKKLVGNMAVDMGAIIDPQVTTDVHRIFRMPGTLNSKSGLAKIRCQNLDTFKLSDACLLDDKSVKVNMRIRNVKLKLKKSLNLSDDVEEMPRYAAVYLICKGLADSA